MRIRDYGYAYKNETPERLPACIVHLIRKSLDCAGWKNHKAVAAARHPYVAAKPQAAEQVLQAFRDGPWRTK